MGSVLCWGVMVAPEETPCCVGPRVEPRVIRSERRNSFRNSESWVHSFLWEEQMWSQIMTKSFAPSSQRYILDPFFTRHKSAEHSDTKSSIFQTHKSGETSKMMISLDTVNDTTISICSGRLSQWLPNVRLYKTFQRKTKTKTKHSSLVLLTLEPFSVCCYFICL